MIPVLQLLTVSIPAKITSKLSLAKTESCCSIDKERATSIQLSNFCINVRVTASFCKMCDCSFLISLFVFHSNFCLCVFV